MNVEEYINDTWEDTVVTACEDEGTLIGLPYPFTCPTVNSALREIYYWDTYFINKGLIISGYAEQAKNNVDNMLYLVDKYGFMPNGNRTYYLANSQCPFLSQMVYDIYTHYKDKAWLQRAYQLLLKEYGGFWQTERITPTGLNRYYNKILSDAERDRLYELVRERVGDLKAVYADKAEDKDYVVHSFGADGESGWDCSPRFAGRQIYGNWVDLNANLYAYEKNFAYYCRELGISDAEKWETAAQHRAALMRKLMWNGNAFVDYDYGKEKQVEIFTTASFYPLVWEMCNQEEAKATKENLKKIEWQHGIAVCEKNDVPGTYQWSYPNGWPCQQYMVAKGLYNYGYMSDALRIAKKYTECVGLNFEKTGRIWEKYNVTDGSINVTNEYEMPDMMGWTAGVYTIFKEFQKTGVLR